MSGQPGFKLTPAQVDRVAPDWRAFLLVRQVPQDEPGCLWWVKVRVAGGWLYELAGRDGEEAELERLLPHGELLEASDAAQGVRRLVITTASHLHGALFIARNGELPPRDWLIGQLAAQEPAPLFAYLAARSPDRAEVWESAVCVCFSVGRSAIMAALVDGGARSVGEIGTATRAGTNCGSCKPELTRLLAEWKQSHAA